MDKRRVVVTGLGIVAPGSLGKEEFWHNCAEGRVFTGPLKAFSQEGIRCPVSAEAEETEAFRKLAGEIAASHETAIDSRAQLLALMGAELALRDSGISLSALSTEKAHIAVGSTMGIEDSLMKRLLQVGTDSSVMFKTLAPSNITSSIASHFPFHNPTTRMFMNACAAGNYAIGNGFEEIKSGRSDIALTGGVDALSYLAVVGFNRLLSVTPDLCRPFDKNRRGIVVGEGAAFLILEELEHARNRGASVYAEVAGFGLGVDAYHITTPSPDGRGAIQAMKRALDSASLISDAIDYVSAHGTGTAANDAAESLALTEVFGEKTPPMSSIKSMIGHTMGAASAIEAAACCLMTRNQEILPTANFTAPDERCPIDCVPNKSRKAVLNHVMSNALAFGGNNSSIIFSALDAEGPGTGGVPAGNQLAGGHDSERTADGRDPKQTADVLKAAGAQAGDVSKNHAKILFVHKFDHPDPESYIAENLPNLDIRMVDRQSLLLMAAVWDAMKANGFQPASLPVESTAIVSGSNHSALNPSLEFLSSALEKGALGVSPMTFPNTVGNAPASRISIWMGLRDKVICLSDGPLLSGLHALLTALEEVNRDSSYAWACSLEEDGAVVALIGRR
jgi:3-oxoacyl-[acyl-carrier-protein] synthase II